ncbi:MAG: HemK2/MTQ2 family protein methyltransferase [Nanoarchaeota archaeon]
MKQIYEPGEDSNLLKSVIARFAQGRVLDMGTGTGILAAEASQFTPEVIGADINNAAIIEASARFPDLRFVETDLFSNISGTFDLITFNPPYLPTSADDPTDIALDGGKQGDDVLLKFFKDAPKHLAPGGNILFLASSLTPMERITKTIKDQGLQLDKIESAKIPFETLTVYKVWKP